jgi:hypothetical protein
MNPKGTKIKPITKKKVTKEQYFWFWNIGQAESGVDSYDTLDELKEGLVNALDDEVEINFKSGNDKIVFGKELKVGIEKRGYSIKIK